MFMKQRGRAERGGATTMGNKGDLQHKGCDKGKYGRATRLTATMTFLPAP